MQAIYVLTCQRLLCTVFRFTRENSSRWGVSHMIDLPAIIPPPYEVKWIKKMGSYNTRTLLQRCEGAGGNFSNAIHVQPTWSRQKTEKQFFLHLFGINWTLTICCSVYFCVLGYVVMVCWRWQSYKTVIINHTYLTYFYKIYHGKMPVQIIHYNCVSIGCDLLWGRRNFISNFCDKIR